MLGYDVYISEIKDKNLQPWEFLRKENTKENLRIIAHVDCIMIDWLNKLVEDGKATLHNGDGYPFRYSAEFGPLMKTLSDMVNDPKRYRWVRQMKISFNLIVGIEPSEIIYLEAWDQS